MAPKRKNNNKEILGYKPSFGQQMRRTDSLKKILMLGKIEGKRNRAQQRMRRLDSITDSVDMNLSKLRGKHTSITGVVTLFVICLSCM